MSRQSRLAAKGLLTALVLLGLSIGGVAFAKTKTPPSIDDLLGMWQVTAKGIEYDLYDGGTYKFGGKGTYTVTKINSTTINMHYQGDGGTWDDVCTYTAGIVRTTSADSDTLGSWSYTSIAFVTGKPGKLKAKGRWHEYDFGDGWFDVGSLSMKQVPVK